MMLRRYARSIDGPGPAGAGLTFRVHTLGKLLPTRKRISDCRRVMLMVSLAQQRADARKSLVTVEVMA
jgi:hypothetical protein